MTGLRNGSALPSNGNIRGLVLTGTAYQYNFRPNWTWRELVAVEVMTPAVGDGPPVAAE